VEATYTFDNIRKDISEGKLTCRQAVDFYLSRIAENNGRLNAFLEVFEEDARRAADAVDEKIRAGKAGKLAGMVIGLKDNICFKDHRVSASSKILEGFKSLYSATVVEKLLAEDAVIIGRLNCDEFAMGSSNENSAFGIVKNPLDERMVPGGSSGGSVAAVAAGLCTVALGSDTGGSIRQPASFCGLVGFKPTYGRISRYGLIAYASSFDQIGPLTRNVEDAALLLEIMSGPDAKDSTTSRKPTEAFHANAKLNPEPARRIAVIRECIEDKGLDPEIRNALQKVIEKLKSDGHTVDMVSFPYLDLMVPVYYVLTTAEASSNLSRFGGIIYGHRSAATSDIDSAFRKSRTEGFGKEVKRRIMLGTFVLSSGYYDAYYSKAQKVRRVLKNKTEEIFSDHDFILLPTTPVTAFKHGDIKDPVAMYLQDIYTVQANLTGNPAISIPNGLHSNGLPFGIQLMGPSFGESGLLSFSRYLQEVVN
jgi:aspartyl-tRNA(Asn)/glutamyl-tRNA(Gln) amidotransferase subunit A